MKHASNAIETWCEAVAKAETSPMTEVQMKLLITYCIGGSQIDNDEQLLKSIEGKKEGMLSAFWLRIKYDHTYEISMSCAAFIVDVIIRGNFGKMAMMANYLQYICHKKHIRKVTMNEFCFHVFPWGAPTDDEWQRLWDLQKVDRDSHSSGMFSYVDGQFHSDNILDYPSCMESIREI